MVKPFVGHALPGSMFLFYGYWWLILCIQRYLSSLKRGHRFQSTLTFNSTLTIWNRTCPSDLLLRTFLPTIGILYELMKNAPEFQPHTSLIHSMMYTPFLLSAVLELLLYKGYPIPTGSDYLVIILGCILEGILILSHLSERSILDVYIHLLVVGVVVVIVLVLCMEMRCRHCPILPLTRCYLTAVQGTWFIHIGIIMNSNNWDMWEQKSVVQATLYFSCHAIVHIMVVFVLLLWMNARFYRVSLAGKKLADYEMCHYSDSLNGDSDTDAEAADCKRPLNGNLNGN